MKQVLAILSIIPCLVMAGPVEKIEPPVIQNPYISNTAWVDVFGFWDNSSTNLGVQATYFVSKYIGVGVEAEARNGIDVGGLIVLRYPDEKLILAPYAVFVARSDSYAAGAGLRVALDHDFDFFVEGRYNWGDYQSAEIRAGIGFRFW